MTANRKKGFYEKYIKVPQDALLALLALILLSPVLLVVALLVRVKLGAPVIFKQERAGKDGKPFYMYKFRSMSDARDADGNLVKPSGVHLEDPIDAPLSETALANIEPYVYPVGAEATLYETTVLAELEALIDQPLYLPDAVKSTAALYRLWAVGSNVHSATIYVNIDISDMLDMTIHLRSAPINIVTGSDPKFSDYILPDGTSVQLAAAERTRGGKTVQAFYLYDAVLPVHGHPKVYYPLGSNHPGAPEEGQHLDTQNTRVYLHR